MKFETKGAQINIYHAAKTPLLPNVENTILIPLYEVM